MDVIGFQSYTVVAAHEGNAQHFTTIASMNAILEMGICLTGEVENEVWMRLVRFMSILHQEVLQRTTCEMLHVL